MSASPKTRPSNPSSGTAPNQRRCPGKRSSSAGTNISSQIPPNVLAIGETTLSERNQRTPIATANTGRRNAPMPKNCNSRSAPNAPTMPIQFRATREPVNTEALFSEGSSGEYDASARKRRSAETHNRKPSSSFSRRLLVGLKMRAMNFIMGTDRVARTYLSAKSPLGPSFRHRRTNAKSTRARQLLQEGCRRAMTSLGQELASFPSAGSRFPPQTPELQALVSTEAGLDQFPWVERLPKYPLTAFSD